MLPALMLFATRCPHQHCQCMLPALMHGLQVPPPLNPRIYEEPAMYRQVVLWHPQAALQLLEATIAPSWLRKVLVPARKTMTNCHGLCHPHSNSQKLYLVGWLGASRSQSSV